MAEGLLAVWSCRVSGVSDEALLADLRAIEIVGRTGLPYDPMAGQCLRVRIWLRRKTKALDDCQASCTLCVRFRLGVI